ncbi:MAG TPA: PAS domain S-box protein, partial [Blastocatellia bacterium]
MIGEFSAKAGDMIAKKLPLMARRYHFVLLGIGGVILLVLFVNLYVRHQVGTVREWELPFWALVVMTSLVCLVYTVAAIVYIRTVKDLAALKATQEALKRSEDRYRNLVEHSHGLICTHDLKGVLLSVNKAAASKLGYLPEELVGRSIQDILSPDAK